MSAPTFPAVIRAALDARMMNVHVSMPARVESYDKSKRAISAQPLCSVSRKGEDGVLVAQRLPVVTNVPVLFSGAGDYWQAFPLKEGDTVWLLFSEHSIDRYLSQGGEVDPGDRRRHDLNDAVAIPGGYAFPEVPDGAPDDAWVINVPTKIKLGSPSADKPPVTKDALDKLMQAIAGAIAAMDLVSVPHLELTALQTALAGPVSGSATWTLGGLADKVLVE